MTLAAPVDALVYVTPISGLGTLPEFLQVAVCPTVDSGDIDVGGSASTT
jgi:hypothetical protein